MENPILEEIRQFAITRLNSEYGFCSDASGDYICMLMSSDREGLDIKVTIKIEEED